MQFSITDVCVSSSSALSFSYPSFFYIMRNADDAILNALNQSTFLYQSDTLETISMLSDWSIALMVTPILCLLLVVSVLVMPTVRTIEDNKLAVLRLFLDIPVQLIHVFRSRIARRLASIENLDALSSKIADGDVQEEDEAAVIEGVLVQIRADNVAQSGRSTSEASARMASERETARRSRQARADDNSNLAQVLRRNLTMIKVWTYVLFTLLYFIITYSVFFDRNKESWTSKPFQINWSAHRTLSMRIISLHLVQFLTQNYTATWHSLPPALNLPLVHADRIQTEIEFVYELIVSLGMGRYCVLVILLLPLYLSLRIEFSNFHTLLE